MLHVKNLSSCFLFSTKKMVENGLFLLGIGRILKITVVGIRPSFLRNNDRNGNCEGVKQLREKNGGNHERINY